MHLRSEYFLFNTLSLRSQRGYLERSKNPRKQTPCNLNIEKSRPYVHPLNQFIILQQPLGKHCENYCGTISDAMFREERKRLGGLNYWKI